MMILIIVVLILILFSITIDIVIIAITTMVIMILNRLWLGCLSSTCRESGSSAELLLAWDKLMH